MNISRTGVLFTGCPTTLDPGAAVEFVLRLEGLGHPGKSDVQCQGRVVRIARTATGGPCAMAATIDGYKFLGFAANAEPGTGEAGPGDTVRS